MVITILTCVLIFVASFYIPQKIFMLAFPIVTAATLFLGKLSLPKIKLAYFIYGYLFLFAVCGIVAYALLFFQDINRYVLEFIIHIIMVGVCCFTYLKKVKQKLYIIVQWTPKSIKIISLILLYLCLFSMVLVVEIYTQASNPKWLFLIHSFLVLLILFVCATIPLLISHAVSTKYFKQLNANYENQIQAQANHYQAVAKNNFEIRRFQHDFKNLVIGLTKLLENQNIQEATELINHYYLSSRGTGDVLLQFDTGNGIVDALLGEKQQSANEYNIQIQFNGAVPTRGISPTDLCILFGNTLDNAIEACRKCNPEEPKVIHVTTKAMAGFFWLTIDNPVAQNVEIRNNTVATTKEDKTLHGFGLYSLQTVAKKHGGSLQLSCQNNRFKTAVELTLDPDATATGIPAVSPAFFQK